MPVAGLLTGRSPRSHWSILYELPQAWEETTGPREGEGSAFYRHFYMGLLREDGTPLRPEPRYALVRLAALRRARPPETTG